CTFFSFFSTSSSSFIDEFLHRFEARSLLAWPSFIDFFFLFVSSSSSSLSPSLYESSSSSARLALFFASSAAPFLSSTNSFSDLFLNLQFSSLPHLPYQISIFA
ncbi:hypothetical protein PENTCL1PPCAC_15217, partial [Pristionchus entomophagus]